jgi:D-sedoheptulose 7-phosphate isomerase
MLPAAILAGGLATRLRPLTETIPKALVEIRGEPFLAHQLRLLRARGVNRVVLCVAYRGEMIRDAVGDGGAYGVEVAYSFDGPILRGTAGALRAALPQLGEAFFVLYGDSYLPCDYRAVEQAFLASGKAALMTVFRNEGQWDSSNVEFDGGRILAYDKQAHSPRMRHIDYGLGVFRREAFEHVPPDSPYDLASLYQDLLRQDRLAASEVSERFYEIGSFEGIEEFTNYMSFTRQYLIEARQIIEQLDIAAIDRVVALLTATRARGGRLFILGVGGSAANASHAVNDFRKIAGMEAYAPTDNVSELTARTNDEGWASVFESWLRVSRLRAEDMVLVFSVGGGNLEKQVSPNLVAALRYAKSVGASIAGIVGRDGGYTAQVADACVIIPTVNVVHTTPHSEAFQAVVWHLIVSHPDLKQAQTKWESVR